MIIKNIPVTRINPAPYNPRVDLKPGDPEYEKLTKSIKQFGYVDPLVWNERTGNLVGGHQRFKVLLTQGIKDVQVSIVNMSLAKEKALNLALNKIAGDWDDHKLAEVLDDLLKTPDLDIESTGFDLPEASKLLDELCESDDGQSDLDLAKELNSITEPVTKSGEIIHLGKHRLMCADSTKPKNINVLLNGKSVDLLFTDPPYGIEYSAIKDKAVVAGDNTKDLIKILRAIKQIDCRTKYVFGHWKTFNDYVKILGPPATVIVWNKSQQSNSSMRGHNFHLYNPRHEFLFYFGSQKHKAGLYEENIWTVANEIALDHPTVKPASLAMRAIRNSTNIGDLILDMFMGLGSTLIAAHCMGRICFGIEKEPRYCDLIVRRYLACVKDKDIPTDIIERYTKKENLL